MTRQRLTYVAYVSGGEFLSDAVRYRTTNNAMRKRSVASDTTCVRHAGTRRQETYVSTGFLANNITRKRS